MSKTLPKNSTYHKPVLLQSACHFLDVQPGAKYIDATLGGGGHTVEIINRGGQVLGLDQDPEALLACPDLDGLTKVQSNFIHLRDVAHSYHWFPVSGIIFDLGVSSHQITTPNRGFSFQLPGPLDMRMDPNLAYTAAFLVNHLSVRDLTKIFADFGEIPTAKSLAEKIVAARPFDTTEKLAGVTGKFSRQAFQALRIAVNDELGTLQLALPQALELLGVGGRLVVISFHSLEDRIVKHQFSDWQTASIGQILAPSPVTGEKSAKLRAFHKNHV